MTREKARELLPVIQAYAEGKTVQCFNPFSKQWEDCTEAGFTGESQWRVKPEPREFWVVVDNKSHKPLEIREYPTGATSYCSLIHVREVL